LSTSDGMQDPSAAILMILIALAIALLVVGADL
jgi:hypothetical protein